ncbi:MAG: hypothetical protein HS111_24125 [Kofleriaceae bacterium]|nr:hypothetical protein [Kofleriaceae bacterium]
MAQLPEPRAELDDHARTALARVIAGGELAPRALGRATSWPAPPPPCAGGRLPAAVRERAHQAVVARLDGARIQGGGQLAALVDAWLDELEPLLAALDPARLDPRFVAGVLVETGARA